MRNCKAKNSRYYLENRERLLEKKKRIVDANRKLPYKQRWTTNRANDNFGDAEHPAPREKMMKWIAEFNAKEEMFAKRMSQLRYLNKR